MRNKLKKIFTTFFLIVFLFVLQLFGGNSFTAQADDACGPGYVCWPSNGGSAAVFGGCVYVGPQPLPGQEPPGSCRGTGATTRYCSCEGSPDCSCTLVGGISCTLVTNPEQDVCTCDSSNEDLDGDFCNVGGGGCLDQNGNPYNYNGTCTCETPIVTTCDLSDSTSHTIGCCYGGSATPTPIPTPGGGGTPTPTPTGTLTPTPVVRRFEGNVFEDANAAPIAIGGTDNLCQGSTATYVGTTSGSIGLKRPGENKDQAFSGASYTITANTNNQDYEISLNIHDNRWQCACNADPLDPYRCVYTNQKPNQGLGYFVNFFVKSTAEATKGWFQTLGGNFWSRGTIESIIPAATCTPPLCDPALILTDPSGLTDSAGFPLSDAGSILTSFSGDNYIHQDSGRSNADQATGLGVKVPVENYTYFFAKFGDKAQALSNANKPTPSGNPGIYIYTGNLTINETHGWTVPNNQQIIVFVNGNLTLTDTEADENVITRVQTGGNGFLMFVVSGDITIDPSIGYHDIYTDASQANASLVEGVFVANGVFTVASSPTPIGGGGGGEPGDPVTQTFTSVGTTSWTAPAGVSQVEVLAVAGGGGGGGGQYHSGGGGGGGALYNATYAVTAGNNYTVTVGGGGAGGVNNRGANGSNSVFGTLTAVGGGGGGNYAASGSPQNGGSGGGASYSQATPGTGTSGQGFNGGNYSSAGSCYGAGGGGGAGGAGGNGSGSAGGAGGIGFLSSITGSAVRYGGGGGGSVDGTGTTCDNAGGAGGAGGGGAGRPGNGVSGTANTGGGGGAGERDGTTGGSGGSGIVIIKYQASGGGGGGDAIGDRKFIGAGTFVGWEGVDLQRSFDDGDHPEYNSEAATETFIFRPDFIVNAPREVKSAQMSWREVAPRF